MAVDACYGAVGPALNQTAPGDLGVGALAFLVAQAEEARGLAPVAPVLLRVVGDEFLYRRGEGVGVARAAFDAVSVLGGLAFLVLLLGNDQVAPSADSSSRVMRATSFKRAPVNKSSLSSGPNGWPIASAPRQNHRIS